MRIAKTFADKALLLVQHLQSMPDSTYYVLHMYVCLITKVFWRRHRRCAFGNLPYFEVYRRMKRLTDGLEYNAAKLSNDYCLRYPLYLDFPKASRTLMTTMHGHCETGRGQYLCYHELNATALELLQEQAYDEIRLRVFLTIGTKLPAKLTELVFERALQAEHIPADTEVELMGTKEHVRRCMSEQKSMWDPNASDLPENIGQPDESYPKSVILCERFNDGENEDEDEEEW